MEPKSPQLSHKQYYTILPEVELHSLQECKLFSLRTICHQPHKHNFHLMHCSFHIPQNNSPHMCLCSLCLYIPVMNLVPREKYQVNFGSQGFHPEGNLFHRWKRTFELGDFIKQVLDILIILPTSHTVQCSAINKTPRIYSPPNNYPFLMLVSCEQVVIIK